MDFVVAFGLISFIIALLGYLAYNRERREQKLMENEAYRNAKFEDGLGSIEKIDRTKDYEKKYYAGGIIEYLPNKALKKEQR